MAQDLQNQHSYTLKNLYEKNHYPFCIVGVNNSI